MKAILYESLRCVPAGFPQLGQLRAVRLPAKGILQRIEGPHVRSFIKANYDRCFSLTGVYSVLGFVAGIGLLGGVRNSGRISRGNECPEAAFQGQSDFFSLVIICC